MSGTASSTRPSSTNCITKVAFSTFVIDPMCITVSAVTFTPVVTLVTPAAAISHWPSRHTAALAPGTLCFWIDAASWLARSSVIEPPDPLRNDCPPAAAGSARRPTAVAAPTAPKVRKRSRLFIIKSFPTLAGGRCSDNSRRRTNTEQMCG